jgi:hypothetical protein
VSRYIIVEGKIRLMQKKGEKREVKIVINKPLRIGVLFDTEKHLLTLKPRSPAAERQLDAIGRLFGREEGGEATRTRFDQLYFGAISVKRYKYVHRDKEIVVNERLLPTDVRKYFYKNSKEVSHIEIDVLRFIGGRLQP